MDCLKAQTCITSYVEGDLTGTDLKEFLLHVKWCQNCREELEIYYTLIEATRQLDEGLLTTNDFMKELEDKINRELNEIHAAEDRRANRKVLAFLLFLCLGAFAFIKITDIPVPILNPPKVTWEEQREHIMEHLYPSMYQPPMPPS
ncbi:MAG: hypothetical protein E7253_11840 [Lachnospiraceae bacterium]|nr:hypothetical protein [Lachnospiraceae bacterium]